MEDGEMVRCEMRDARWEMGNGTWGMGHGGWEMGNGTWEMGNGRGCRGYFRRLKVFWGGGMVVVRDFSLGLGFKI